jgi:hypothetical protein
MGQADRAPSPARSVPARPPAGFVDSSGFVGRLLADSLQAGRMGATNRKALRMNAIRRFVDSSAKNAIRRRLGVSVTPTNPRRPKGCNRSRVWVRGVKAFAVCLLT